MDDEEQDNEDVGGDDLLALVPDFAYEEDDYDSASDVDDRDHDSLPDEEIVIPISEMGSSASHSQSTEAGNADSGSNRRLVTFNRALPAVHAYLGRDLEEVRAGGQSFFAEGAVVESIPLFYVPNMFLMPGQTLPFQSLHPRLITMFRTIITRSSVFGVVNLSNTGRNANTEDVQRLDDVGTIAQIVAFKEEADNELVSMKVRAVGRQRFQVLETFRQIDGIVIAKVRILPEISVDQPLKLVESAALSKLKLLSDKSASAALKAQKRKYYASALTPWPWFVYKYYDMDFVLSQVAAKLSEWYDKNRIDELAKSPVDFSYWVATNLPLENEMKQRLLRIDCTLQRLRFELSLLQKLTVIVCRECSLKIGHKDYVFSMSVDGPIGAFVNEYGHVHETITLTQLLSPVAATGSATTANSWFPGYAWTIINCSNCYHHLGWKFSACRRNLKPETFYGITRVAVLPSYSRGSSDEQEEELPCM